MNRNQVLALSLSVLISLGGLVSGGAAFATSPNNEKSDDLSFVLSSECQFESLTFEQFMKGVTTSKIPKEDMKKLKSLYDDITKLEKDEKFDDADKKWGAFDKILNNYIKHPSFEEFMKDMSTKKIPADDINTLKSLYKDIIKLEKGNKFDDSNKKWDEFYKILDKYLDEELELVELPSFEEFIKSMPTKKISTDDMSKLKSLYKDITKLEKGNKFDDSNKKWDEFYKILDKYLENCNDNGL